MENYRLVLPEHLNHYGFLFGGVMLMWVDEISWIGATLDFPSCKFATVGMDKVEFKRSIKQGSLLRFDVSQDHVGTTSVRYRVDVYNTNIGSGAEEHVFSTTVAFVCMNERGEKREISG